MPRLNYALKDYIKAVEILASTKNLQIKCFYTGKNGVRFEVFQGAETIPWDMWVVHTEHSKRREIWSRDNYKKPDQCIGAEAGTFVKILESLK